MNSNDKKLATKLEDIPVPYPYDDPTTWPTVDSYTGGSLQYLGYLIDDYYRRFYEEHPEALRDEGIDYSEYPE